MSGAGTATYTVDLGQVFGELADLRRWVCWQKQTRKGKPTKVPISPRTGRRTDATKPNSAEHVTLDEALTHAELAGMDGVGIVLGLVPELGVRLGGWDLDACRDPLTGQLTPWARSIVDEFGTYTEVSPSDTGVKGLAFGAPAEVPCSEIPQDTPPINGKAAEIAVYPAGRYFTVTGRIITGVPDEIRDAGDLGDGWDKLVARLERHARRNGTRVAGEAVAPTGATAIPERLRQELNGPGKAGRLWTKGADAGNDRSRNDAALAATLGARGFEDPDVEAALRSFPLGQVGQGALGGPGADRQVSRLLGLASEARSKRDEDADDDRPTIRIREDLTAVTREAMEAVKSRPDLGVFVRGRILVTVGRDGSARERWLERPPGSPVIVPLEHARLLGILDQAARFEKWNKKEQTAQPARPPDWVAHQIAGRLEWPFRYLEAVTETPTIRADGSILETAGWDAATGILYDPPPGAEWAGVPERPTADDVSRSVADLLAPVGDFPFVSGGDRAAYVAVVLSLLARHRIAGPVPMFVIRTPTPGTGKTLLALIAGLIGTGRTPPTMTMVYEGEELRKRITSLAVGGTPLVLIDNMSGSVGSDALAAALTSTEWEDRILGASQMVRVPLNTVWIGTGNNLTFRRTLGRRVIPIDMDAGCEVPEDRTGFRYPDLLAHVRSRRLQLVRAALTVLRGFHLAGSPAHGGTRMGSFEAWDDFARSAVIWAGLDDPASTDGAQGRGRIRAQSDDDLEGLGTLLEALEARFTEGVPFSTAQVIRAGKEDPEFGDVLDVVAAPARGGHATAHSLGARLRDHQGRPVGGLVLRKINRTWKVETAAGGS